EFFGSLTVNTPGQWTLVLDRGNSPNYTMDIHLGGGGNDCVSGRDPARVPPNVTDASNYFSSCIASACPFPPPPASALPLLGQEISCTGSFTLLDLDSLEQYNLPVLANEPVAVNVLPDLPGSILAFTQVADISGFVLHPSLDSHLGLTQAFSPSMSGFAF